MTDAERAEAVQVMANAAEIGKRDPNRRKAILWDMNAALRGLLAAGFVVKKENVDG